MASFLLNFKDSVTKYSHMLRYWGLGLQKMKFRMGTIWSIVVRNVVSCYHGRDREGTGWRTDSSCPDAPLVLQARWSTLQSQGRLDTISGPPHEEEFCGVEAFTHLGLGWKFMPSTLGTVSLVLACPQGRTGYLGSTLLVMLSPTQVDQEHVSWSRKPPPAPILPQEVLS